MLTSIVTVPDITMHSRQANILKNDWLTVGTPLRRGVSISLSVLQSRCGNKPLRFRVFPHNGAVPKGSIAYNRRNRLIATVVGVGLRQGFLISAVRGVRSRTAPTLKSNESPLHSKETTTIALERGHHDMVISIFTISLKLASFGKRRISGNQ